MKKLFLLIWLIAALICTTAGYAQDDQNANDNDHWSEAQEGEDYQASIMEVLSADERFSIFVEAVEIAGLSEMLDEDEILTVFAPTDSAFDKIPAEELDRIMADRKLLKELLSGHIVEDDLWTDDLVEADSVETINNKTLIITKIDKQVMVNGIPIIDPDIDCYNGVIQGIDSVILPAPND